VIGRAAEHDPSNRAAMLRAYAHADRARYRQGQQHHDERHRDPHPSGEQDLQDGR